MTFVLALSPLLLLCGCFWQGKVNSPPSVSEVFIQKSADGRDAILSYSYYDPDQDGDHSAIDWFFDGHQKYTLRGLKRVFVPEGERTEVEARVEANDGREYGTVSLMSNKLIYNYP
jgi:hypothetical protein